MFRDRSLATIVRLAAVSIASLTALLTAFSAAPASASGQPDPAFDGDGWLELVYGVPTRLSAVTELPATAQSPRRLLVAGTAGGVIDLSRLELDGSLDTSFGTAGVTSISVPGASDADVVKLLDQPFGSGYLVLVKARIGVEDEGFLLRLDAAGFLDTSWPNGGFLTLSTVGPYAVTDMEICCSPGVVAISGQDVFHNGSYDGAVRFVDTASGSSFSPLNWPVAGTQEAAHGIAQLPNGRYAALRATSSLPETIEAYRNDLQQNNGWADAVTFPGWTLRPQALAGGNVGFVAASWVDFGPADRPLLLSAWRQSGILIEPDPDFGVDGQQLISVPFNLDGYDALRPEEIVFSSMGFTIAATQLGAAGGPLRRVKTLAVDERGQPLWQGPALLGPDSLADHDVSDLVTLDDGRLLLTVTSTDRLDPTGGQRGWLLMLKRPDLFADGFESGDLAAWAVVVGGP